MLKNKNIKSQNQKQKSKCKGPEVGGSLVSSRDRRQTRWLDQSKKDSVMRLIQGIGRGQVMHSLETT